MTDDANSIFSALKPYFGKPMEFQQFMLDISANNICWSVVWRLVQAKGGTAEAALDFCRFLGIHTQDQLNRWVVGDEDSDDLMFLDPSVPFSKIAAHKNFMTYLQSIGNKEGQRILEIGSREVTGKSSARHNFAKAEYVGFDYYPGDNVNVVGDAHRLSASFSMESFDIVYTSACFEHFAMPWIVAAEMVKVLKIGGIVFVETHFSYGSHERPWHFFQFSDMGLKVLFNPAIGVECIEAGMSNPMIGRFSSLADSNLRNKQITGLYCHSEFLGRKVKSVDSYDWNTLSLDQVVGNTKYPTDMSIKNYAENFSLNRPI